MWTKLVSCWSLLERIAAVDEMKSIGVQRKANPLGFYLRDLVGDEFLTDVLSRHGDDFRSGGVAAALPP